MELRWENMYYEINYSLNGIFQWQVREQHFVLACLCHPSTNFFEQIKYTARNKQEIEK